MNINPLTLYVAVKQDALTQAAVKILLDELKGGNQLDDENFIHFARTAGVPNTSGGYLGILVITEFDGPMNNYLKYFYGLLKIKLLFAAIYEVALIPPASPDNLENFENFINANNLNNPGDLSYAYTATVAQIVAKFPPAS